MKEIQIDRSKLHADLVRIFAVLKVPEPDARMVADVLIRTEQWGVRSHGVMRVKRYVECLISGGIRPDAGFTVEKRSGAWAQASANGGLGIPASVRATELAMDLAREHVVGMVNVRMSHHNGAEGYYARMCAERGMIGIVMSTGNPIMAVAGSVERTIGNNPMAYGVPAGKYGEIVLDMAMSAVADGKVQQARALGRQLPPGCFLDAEGRPATDPDAYLNGGVLLPFAAHKGSGLAVMVECLAGILSGAALTQEIDSWNCEAGKCGNTGHCFIAVDISRILPPEIFTGRVEEMIEEFKSSRRAPDAPEIYYPGELEMRRYLRDPEKVELYPSTLEALREAARMAGAGRISA